MENWLDFDYRQTPDVQNSICGEEQALPYCQGQTPVAPFQQVKTPIPRQMPTTSAQGTQMQGGMATGGPDFEVEPGAPVQQNRNYIQGFLRTQIGKTMRIEFLIGTNVLTDRVGTLVEVGIDHVALVPFNSNDLTVADLYSIKFVEVFGGASDYPLPSLTSGTSR